MSIISLHKYTAAYQMQFTDKQIICLQAIADGFSLKKIADLLEVEVSTINSHISLVKKKLAAKTTAHAVYLAVSKGII